MEREALNEHSGEPQQDRAPVSSPAVDQTEFPDEPFACPHCGQLLASSCRKCVSCKREIDPRDIPQPELPNPEPTPGLPRTAHPAEMRIPREYAHFSWMTFLNVIVIWFVMAYLSEQFLGYRESQFFLAGVVAGSSCWVYFDARKKQIPRALRWTAGSLLLWIVFFPWYLARRRRPGLPCPFVESDSHRYVHIVLIAFFIFLLFTILAMFFQSGGLGKHKSTPAPNSHLVMMLNQGTTSRNVVDL